MRHLTSETAIKYMETGLIANEVKIKELEKQKAAAKINHNTINMEVVVEHIKYFLEHLQDLVS
jgi:hypothetical protein